MEEDFRSRLTGDPGVSAAVKSAAIAWGDRPQASGLPGISIETISDKLDQHMLDFQGFQSTQVQLDIWASDKQQARDIRRLVITALAGPAIAGGTRFGRLFVDRRDSSSEGTETGIIYRERLDLTVWHASTT